jgi:hypothetical protein
VTHKHYEVAVLGRSIGALTAAALLARRGFTVLVLGQGERPPTYKLAGRVLRRRAFTMLAATSPTWRRVVVELAQSQTWKRRIVPISPMMQVLSPGRRLDIPPDMVLWTREIDPLELRRVVGELEAELARLNGAADDAFEHDAVWPPGTFWERRETNRYAAMLPYVRAEPDADFLVEFPRGHLFRQIVLASVAFATDLSAVPPPFAWPGCARGHAARSCSAAQKTARRVLIVASCARQALPARRRAPRSISGAAAPPACAATATVRHRQGSSHRSGGRRSGEPRGRRGTTSDSAVAASTPRWPLRGLDRGPHRGPARALGRVLLMRRCAPTASRPRRRSPARGREATAIVHLQRRAGRRRRDPCRQISCRTAVARAEAMHGSRW